MTDPEVQRLRDEISAADRRVLDAVNARVALVEELKAVKERLGLGFVDADREREIVEGLVDANGGPLSDDGVRELVREVLDLTKREVRGRGSAAELTRRSTRRARLAASGRSRAARPRLPRPPAARASRRPRRR